MHTIHALIIDLTLITIYAGITTLICKKLKQPIVLGYVLAGIFAGPYFDLLPTVSDRENLSLWADIGVIFLLFGLGLEFSFKKMLNVGKSAMITANANILFMLFLGYYTGLLLGWSTTDSFFLGSMISMSSTTIIIKAFDDLNIKKQKFTDLVFGVLVIEDLVGILLLVLLPMVALGQSINGGELALSTFKLLSFLILCFVIGIYIVPTVLKKLTSFLNDEMLLLITVGMCFGMVWLATASGFSSALGAFLMGSVLSETGLIVRIENVVRPLKDFFGAVFFVSVGMMVDPAMFVTYAGPIAVVTLIVVVGKVVFSCFGFVISGQSLRTSTECAFSLAQVGEFAFIIAGLGVSLKVLDPFISPIIVAVSVITTFTTPYFIRLTNPFAEWLYKILPTKIQETLDRYASGKKTMNHDSDWKKLLKNMIGRVIIYSVLLTAIWLLSIQIIYPAISEMFAPVTLWINLVMCLGTLLLMTPFLWALISNKYNSYELFLKLWRDENYNHGRLVSLVLGRVSVALFFITSVVISYFKLNWGISVIIAIAVVALILILREDLTQYSRLETRFLANLNRREEAAKKRHPLKTSFNSEFNDKDLDLTSILVSPYSDYISKSLGELSFRQNFGVNVVAITRGDLNIYIPKSSEHIYPQDKLTVVGTDTQLQEFRNRIEDVKNTIDTDAVDKKMTLHSFTVDDEFRFLNKTIAQSHLGEKYDGIVVAIERNDELIPLDKDTAFQLGDLVWIVGKREKIRDIL